MIPKNEKGVIYLFSRCHEDHGIEKILKIRSKFPDCIATMGGREIRIEFEYKSLSFLQHEHLIEGADLIVCWIHNWNPCPMRVLDLKAGMIYEAHPIESCDIKPRDRRLPEFLSQDDARELLKTPYLTDLRDRLIIELMLKCGLRTSEIVSGRGSVGISKRDLEFDGNDDSAHLRVFGRKGSERYIPVPRDVAKIFTEYTKDMENDQRIFNITVWSIAPLVGRYAKRAGIKLRVWPEKLRHTFAVNALLSGWNLKELQEVLGHEHLSSTEKYLHLTDDDIATAHKRHPLSY